MALSDYELRALAELEQEFSDPARERGPRARMLWRRLRHRLARGLSSGWLAATGSILIVLGLRFEDGLGALLAVLGFLAALGLCTHLAEVIAQRHPIRAVRRWRRRMYWPESDSKA